MGTSSSGIGPGNNSQLLPNWGPPEGTPPPENPKPELPDTENPDINVEPADKFDQEAPKIVEKIPTTGDWKSIKTTVGRIANGSKNLNFKGVAKGYIRTLGGVKNAVRASRSGVSGGASIAKFLSSIGRNGFEETMRFYGLSECIGKSAEEVFAKLSDKICPAGNTNEEAITRKALLDTLCSLYEKFVDKDNITLDNLQKEDIEKAVTDFVSNYIYRKWLYELGLAIENKRINEADALSLEEQMKEFIFEEVRVEFKGKEIMEIDFRSGEGKNLIEDIFEQSYSTLIS
jgi:Fe-S cluster biosynthesis and repair protein YggX